MKKIKRFLIIGVAAAIVFGVVSLGGCKSEEQKKADAVNSVINNIVDKAKGN